MNASFFKNGLIFRRIFCNSSWVNTSSCFWTCRRKVDFLSNPLYSVVWKCPLHRNHSIDDGDAAAGVMEKVKVQFWLKLCENRWGEQCVKESKESPGRWKDCGYTKVCIAIVMTSLIERFYMVGNALKS